MAPELVTEIPPDKASEPGNIPDDSSLSGPHRLATPADRMEDLLHKCKAFEQDPCAALMTGVSLQEFKHAQRQLALLEQILALSPAQQEAVLQWISTSHHS